MKEKLFFKKRMKHISRKESHSHTMFFESPWQVLKARLNFLSKSPI